MPCMLGTSAGKGGKSCPIRLRELSCKAQAVSVEMSVFNKTGRNPNEASSLGKAFAVLV